MNKRPPVYRSEALAHQADTEDFEQLVQLIRIKPWLIRGIGISLLVLIGFWCGWLLLAGR